MKRLEMELPVGVIPAHSVFSHLHALQKDGFAPGHVVEAEIEVVVNSVLVVERAHHGIEDFGGGRQVCLDHVSQTSDRKRTHHDVLEVFDRFLHEGDSQEGDQTSSVAHGKDEEAEEEQDDKDLQPVRSANLSESH